MVPLGVRIRGARKKIGLTQSSLAKEVGVSVSYLNLIEHGKRKASDKLLVKLAQYLEIDLSMIKAPQDARRVQDLESLMADPFFRDADLETEGAEIIVDQIPKWSDGVLSLFNAYQNLNKSMEGMSNRLNTDPYLVDTSHKMLNFITSIRSFSEIFSEFPDLSIDERMQMAQAMTKESENLGVAARTLFDFINEPGKQSRHLTPQDQVNDFLIDQKNYFPQIEEMAEALLKKVHRSTHRLNDDLFHYLEYYCGMSIRFTKPIAEDMPGTARKYTFEPGKKRLSLANTLPEQSVRFQLVQFLFELIYADEIQEIIKKEVGSDDPQVVAGMKRALENYAAGAFLFPYAPFLEACEKTRYDIQMLSRQFGGSFEQICHRFVTLRRDGSEGIPFAFMRVDPAGNISKRFSMQNLRLPRAGGACPLLSVYRAFLDPGQIKTQVSSLPEGFQMLEIAKTVSKHVGAFGEPDRVYSVMIACDEIFMERVVYGDRYVRNDTRHEVPVGIHCRTCPRQHCQHRAHSFVLGN